MTPPNNPTPKPPAPYESWVEMFRKKESTIDCRWNEVCENAFEELLAEREAKDHQHKEALAKTEHDMAGRAQAANDANTKALLERLEAQARDLATTRTQLREAQQENRNYNANMFAVKEQLAASQQRIAELEGKVNVANEILLNIRGAKDAPDRNEVPDCFPQSPPQ